MTIESLLMALKDEGYQRFHAALIPSLDPKRILGVRMPKLRALAKRLWTEDSPLCEAHIQALQAHWYYEDFALHALFLERLPLARCLEETEAFVQAMDNWAICDLYRPKVLYKDPRLIRHIERWICSERPYTVRFAFVLLLRAFLDDAFEEKQLRLLLKIQSQDDYVTLAMAWYLAEGLVKQYEAVLAFLEEGLLPDAVLQKTLQKAKESRRVSKEKQDRLALLIAYLRS